MHTNTIKKQSGVALITVLLIVSLAAILATEMSGRLQMQMQRSANVTFNQQAYWYAMGAEAFGTRVLAAVFKEEPDVTNLSQAWAQGETSYPVDFGQITGEIRDLQSCLNLNALRADVSATNPDGNADANGGSSNSTDKVIARRVLEDLIIALNIEDVGQFEAESMADALTDWLDADSSIESVGGAEDNDYSSLEFPYLPANNFLSSVEELRVVANFTAPVILALKPYVCVLPDTVLHKININTLNAEQPELLQALLGKSKDDAQKILSAREDSGYETAEDFLNSTDMLALSLDDERKEQFAVDSEYFTLQTTASFNESYFSLNSLMKVENNKIITVISRTIGHN